MTLLLRETKFGCCSQCGYLYILSWNEGNPHKIQKPQLVLTMGRESIPLGKEHKWRLALAKGSETHLAAKYRDFPGETTLQLVSNFFLNPWETD